MKPEQLKYNEKGLIPVITQDVNNNQVLMLAYAKKEQIQKTLDTKLAHYYSRSRQCEWLKGDTSGHYQHVEQVLIDCDADTVIYRVKQEGNACHTGEYSCFYRELQLGGDEK